MNAEQFVISPRPAIRAYFVAAGLALLAILVLLADSLVGWGAWVIVPALLLIVAAAVLLGLALASGRRNRVLVNLDDQGYRVLSPGQEEASGAWRAVTRVTSAPGRITLHEGDEKRTHLIVPSGSDADLDALGAAIGRHLDADRGYTLFEG